MASSITGDAKKVLLDQFKQDLDSSGSQYYIGISGADSTGVGLLGQQQFRNEMQFVKIISSNSFVVETYNWTSGVVYNAYDNENLNQKRFYVVNDLNEVFLCVQTSKNASGVEQPSSTKPTAALAAAYDNNRRSFTTSDGYVWRYLYQMSGLAINRFKTSTYMPVQQIRTTSSIFQLNEQRTLQNNSINGEILGIAIDSGGTGYEFAPRLDIEGNGDSASFSVSLENGKIVAITVDSDGFGKILHGSGYDFAKVIPSAGDAVLRPIIGPKGGVNLDPVATLRADKLMVQTTIQNDENGTIPLADPTNDFKSVALLRKPNTYGSQDDYTASVGNAMNYFTVSAGSGTFAADETFETAAQVKGKTHWHDTSNNRLYYIQNDSTGFGTFNVSDTISSISGTGTSKDIDAINNPQIDRYSGEILYINTLNSAIDRTSAQTEDIRVVIDLGQD